MSLDESALPAGWRRWSEDAGGRAVLVYRPDVFDSDAFPPECLPTIYVTEDVPRARTGPRRGGDGWRVTLYAEPEVELAAETRPDRAGAVEAALSLAERFAAGEVDYRDAYQLPREAYLDRLDELTGRDA